MTGTSAPGLWQRLRERGVFRVAASYAVIAWLLLQIADVTFEPLGVPGWVMPALIVAALLGLPVALALAWFYEVGDRGVAPDTATPGTPRPAVHGVRRYADIAIIAVLLVTVAGLLVRQTRLGTAGEGEATIAVLPFKNLSMAAEGEVLASGIAEAVLHQLGSLAQLDVISRTSSFAFRDRAVDAREIGKQLGARFLLEGSVQSDRTRLQVTTQLIDTTNGAEVWSMRFLRRPGDIFAIQDEIAEQVTRALELSVDPAAIERMRGQGTRNLDAYLAFLQGRALLASGRVVDTKESIAQFERAVKLDPEFAAAYVSQAEAELFVAEYEVVADRRLRFQRALGLANELVERALSLNPESGDALLQRAYLRAFDDKAAAEVDYRHGLELQPNSAKGYAGLATVLYASPERREEALSMLDRARKLDPLAPDYDVFKALFLMYHRADLSSAGELLVGVLDRDPTYMPALLRLCEMRGQLEGRLAEGLMYCERAIELDPQAEAPRRLAVVAYLSLDEPMSARARASHEGREFVVPRILIEAHAERWVEAGERAYEALSRGVGAPDTRTYLLTAVRMHARLTGESARARQAIEAVAGVTWDEAGNPTLPGRSPLRDYEVALADLLLLDGDEQRGRRLLAEILTTMRREVHEEGRPELWYRTNHPVALALDGKPDEALAMIARSVDSRQVVARRWQVFRGEPTLAPLRSTARFKELVQATDALAAEEKMELQRLRAEGLVPDLARATP